MRQALSTFIVNTANPGRLYATVKFLRFTMLTINMDVNELLEIIREGENERVEFKRKATPEIAKEVCAMANAEGGYILIGVDNSGRVVGCDPQRAKEVLTSALQNVTPPVNVRTDIVELGDKKVLVIKVLL